MMHEFDGYPTEDRTPRCAICGADLGNPLSRDTQCPGRYAYEPAVFAVVSGDGTVKMRGMADYLVRSK